MIMKVKTYHVFSIKEGSTLRTYFKTVGGWIAEYSLSNAEFEVHLQTKLYAAENTVYGIEQAK